MAGGLRRRGGMVQMRDITGEYNMREITLK
jgi:hypothetical protein